MKDQCKNNLALHLRSYIPIPQYWPGVPRTYDILATFKLSCDTSHIKSPAFTSAVIILRCGIIFYMHMHLIFTQNIWRWKVLGCQFKGNPKLLCNIIFSFFDSTLNSMGGVRCSATLNECLKRENLSEFITIRITSLVSRSIIML